MLRTILILPDGREISSGASAENAILNVKLTQCVNDAQELNLGSACANMLEVNLQTPEGGLQIAAGDELTVYKEDDIGQRHLVGIYITEKPTRATANTLRLTAYDRVTRLDRDLADWLAGLDGWPYSLLAFAKMVCEACGLTLVNDSLPNGGYPVQAFSARGITGRKLMQWVGQIAGRFCRATPDGKIEFAWYTPSGVTITPGGDRFYLQNGLSYEDYQVSPVEKVQLRLTEDDVGVIWPNDTGEKNTYIISGNYLLTTTDGNTLLPVAKTLYNQLKDVTYTPCKVRLPACTDIRAGHTVQITDRNGKTFSAYVMTKTQSGGVDTLECTGSPRRDSTTVVNYEDYRVLNSKLLELRKQAEGLSVTVSSVEKSIQGVKETAVFSPEVSGQNTKMIAVKNALPDSISDLHIYGHTTQDGTPAPDAVVEPVSAGAGGTIGVIAGSSNLCDMSKFSWSKYYTLGEDGYISITNPNAGSGTAGRLYPAYWMTVPKGTYTVSFELDKFVEIYVSKENKKYTAANRLDSSGKVILRDTEGVYIMVVVSHASSLKFRVTINAGDTALPWEPYNGQTLTVSTPNGLPGIPVSSGGNYTDANGQQWICDEIDFSRGVYVQRVNTYRMDSVPANIQINSPDLWTDTKVQFAAFGVVGEAMSAINSSKDTSNVGLVSIGSYVAPAFEAASVSGAKMVGTLMYMGGDRSVFGDTVASCKAYLQSLIDAGTPLTVVYRLADFIETGLPAEEVAAFAAWGNPPGSVTIFSEADISAELAGAASSASVDTAKKEVEQSQNDIATLNKQVQSIHETNAKLSIEDDAIRASVRDLEGVVDSTANEVLEAKEQIASMNLYSNQLEVKIEKIANDGVKKVSNTTGTFNEEGLTIDSTDSATKTQVTPDGMTVYRKAGSSDTAVLTANSDGVDAANLHATTYLMVGRNSRFEDYGSGRTGCFWTGG